MNYVISVLLSALYCGTFAAVVALVLVLARRLGRDARDP